MLRQMHRDQPHPSDDDAVLLNKHQHGADRPECDSHARRPAEVSAWRRVDRHHRRLRCASASRCASTPWRSSGSPSSSSGRWCRHWAGGGIVSCRGRGDRCCRHLQRDGDGGLVFPVSAAGITGYHRGGHWHDDGIWLPVSGAVLVAAGDEDGRHVFSGRH